MGRKSEEDFGIISWMAKESDISDFHMSFLEESYSQSEPPEPAPEPEPEKEPEKEDE
jgi:hypothetical protein